MRLVMSRRSPVQEIAAEPGTLTRLATALRLAIESPTTDHAGTVLHGGSGLFSLPLVPDDTLTPGDVHLRPYSTPMGTDRS